MDIWLIIDGEKSGPIHDFEVRKRIQSGELDAGTPAWHDGLAAWQTLGEIACFAGEFEANGQADGDGRESIWSPPVMVVPPPLPSDPQVLRRFWARWLDLYMFAGVWWFLLWAAGCNIGEILQNPWILLFLYVPWFAIEAWLIHRFGTTPGKRLLGLSVLNDDGSRLSLAQSAHRAFRVLFLGIGFGWELMALILQVMAVVTTKRLGRPLWDHAGGHRVIARPLNPLSVAAYVIALFLVLQLQWIVIAPYAIENAVKIVPALKEQIEKNPPWHLPQRHPAEPPK